MNRNNRVKLRGSALVIAMSMLLMLSMLGISVLNTSLSSSRMAVHRRDGEAAFEIAEAGLAHALEQLRKKDGRSYAGEGPIPFGAGTFQVEVSTPVNWQGRREVTSIGRVQSLGGGFLEKRTGAVIDLQSPVWNYSIITEKDLNLTGGFQTDSMPTAQRGDVHSNKNMTLDEGVYVDGRASAAETITVLSATVTGGSYPNYGKIPFPKFDKVAALADAESRGTIVGDVAFASGTRVLGGVIKGNLSVSSTARLVVDGILWVTGKVSFTGWSYGGDGLLVSEGSVYMAGGNGFTGSEGNHLAIVCLANDARRTPAFEIAGQAKVRGGLLIPHGTLTLSGQARIWGSIAANELAGSGKAHVTCINNFTAPPQVDDPGVRYWQEL